MLRSAAWRLAREVLPGPVEGLDERLGLGDAVVDLAVVRFEPARYLAMIWLYSFMAGSLFHLGPADP